VIPTQSVIVQRNNGVRGSDGTYTDVWATLSTPKLHVRQLTGKEVEDNKKLGFDATYRWYDFTGSLDITTKDRIVYNSENYLVERVNDPHFMGNHKEIDTRIIK